MPHTAIISEICSLLHSVFDDTPVIALAGAHAKGVADEHSDIDIFVFGNRPKPYEKRAEIIRAFCDNPQQCYISEELNHPWGGSLDFTYQGVPVEIVVRLMDKTEQVISECLQGKFQIIPQTWTSNGYYTYIYLSEMEFLKPLCDNSGWLAAQKAKIRPYPALLKRAVIQTFLERAGTWIGNFHYASAVKRADTLFTAPIVTHTLMDLIQVIFALNESYFPGDKKLQKALSALPDCPALLLEHLDFLLENRRDVSYLSKQAEILTQIYKETAKRAADFCR